MGFFVLPNSNRLISGLFFILDFHLFFSTLYSAHRAVQRLKSGLYCYLIYSFTLGFTTRHHLLFVLFIHTELACLCAWLLHKETTIQLPYAFFLAFSFIICRGTWNAQILHTILPFIPIHHSSIPDKLITLLFLLLAKRYVLHIDASRTLAWKELLSSLFPLYAMFFARIAIYHYCYYLESSISSEANQVFSWIGSFLALATIFALAANEILFSHYASRRQLELAQAQLKQQYEMFTERQRSNEQLKRIYHDMTNHLSILRKLNNPEEVSRYISSIDHETQTALEETDTSNETLNLLLRQKGEECRKAGLTLEAAVRYPKVDFLTPMEICTLFANCIDNAIEAVSNSSVSDKTIRISGYEQHGCFVVRFENAYAHTLHYKNKHLVSNKKSPLHGYGLQNVRTILDKHDGALSIHPQDGRFVLTFMLPIDQLSYQNDQLL